METKDYEKLEKMLSEEEPGAALSVASATIDHATVTSFVLWLEKEMLDVDPYGQDSYRLDAYQKVWKHLFNNLMRR